jgi:hypothetical protein
MARLRKLGATPARLKLLHHLNSLFRRRAGLPAAGAIDFYIQASLPRAVGAVHGAGRRLA